jgi:hypothetical protein
MQNTQIVTYVTIKKDPSTGEPVKFTKANEVRMIAGIILILFIFSGFLWY